MEKTDGLIKPLRPPAGLEPGFSVLMVSHPADIAAIPKSLNLKAEASHRVLMSRLYILGDLTVIGPFMGAPYAVALLENLIAWGAGEIIYYGWAGALSSVLGIGDVIIPTRALVDEGTTRCYFNDNTAASFPNTGLQEKLQSRLDVSPAAIHGGAIWTTDGLFNETPEKIAHYQAQEALAVEMEASALFSVSGYRSIPIGCLLVISDDLSHGDWQPGFSEKRFKRTRHRVCSLLPEIFMTKGDL